MELVTRVQILGETVCNSLYTNVHGKGMKPSIPNPDMSKEGKTELFSFGTATNLEGKLNPN